MTRKAVCALALFLCAWMAHAQADHRSGHLYRVPTTQNADFQYHDSMVRTVQQLQRGETLKLQSRFIWGPGPVGRAITMPQHAVVAFTQQGSTSNMVNPRGQMYWTHGVGAFVGDRGLQIELWYATDTQGNGFNDDPLNAVSWGQHNQRCVADVLGTIQVQALCLGAEPNGWGYLTPAPGFTLRAGIPYWVRVTITPTQPGWANLLAELYEQQDCDTNGCTTKLVQHGLVGFQIAQFFPLSGLPIQASNGRTTGSAAEPYVQYDTFNHGW